MIRESWVGDLQRIKLLVCESFGVKLVDLVSDRRQRAITTPRHIAFWLCRELTPASLPQIGREFNGRDHTTVISGIDRAEMILAKYPRIKAQADEVIRKWNGAVK